MDENIRLKLFLYSFVGVFHFHSRSAFDGSHSCTRDILHFIFMGGHHLLPKWLPSILQQRDDDFIRSKCCSNTAIRCVRMMPPKQVKGGDLIQNPITLNLLAVKENRLQNFQSILLQEFHGGHVDSVPILWLRGQAIWIFAKNAFMESAILHQGSKNRNVLCTVWKASTTAWRCCFLWLFKHPIKVFQAFCVFLLVFIRNSDPKYHATLLFVGKIAFQVVLQTSEGWRE